MNHEGHTYNIGLIVADIEDDFSNALTKGAMRAASQTGDSLFIYPVKYLDTGISNAATDPKQKYEYQYNMLFSYVQTKQLDFLLIGMSSIGFRSTREKCLAVLADFKDIPIFLLCSREDGCSSVMYNNSAGMRQGIDYLIKTRGLKKFGMLSGLPTNEDAVERERVYRDTLHENNIEIDEGAILHIRDSGICADIAEELIMNNPELEAIICFNDETAKGAYTAMSRHSLRPGLDIAILGFDDIPSAGELDPPLATIRADASLISENALLNAHDMLENGDISCRHIIVNTEFVLRESASGARQSVLSIKEYQWQIMRYKERLESIRRMDKRMNIVSRDMLMFGSSNRKYYTRFLEALIMPEIGDCYLYVFDHPVLYRKDAPWRLPAKLYLRACKIDQIVKEPPVDEQEMSIDDIYDNPYFTPSGKALMFIDIYSRSMQYGVLLCEIPFGFFRYVEQLCFQISIAVKIMNLFQESEKLLFDRESLLNEKESILKKLEKENLILGKISSKDELTEIYNRRGFVLEADKALENPDNIGSGACLFYSDLNYLKLINDRYGHSEGDFAIQTCARTFTEVFSDNAIVSRIGGDEFAVLISNCRMSSNDYIAAIKNKLAEKDAASGKNYHIRMSVGAFEFTINGDCDLKILMDQADAALYKDKLNKPSFD